MFTIINAFLKPVQGSAHESTQTAGGAAAPRMDLAVTAPTARFGIADFSISAEIVRLIQATDSFMQQVPDSENYELYNLLGKLKIVLGNFSKDLPNIWLKISILKYLRWIFLTQLIDLSVEPNKTYYLTYSTSPLIKAIRQQLTMSLQMTKDRTYQSLEPNPLKQFAEAICNHLDREMAACEQITQHPQPPHSPPRAPRAAMDAVAPPQPSATTVDVPFPPPVVLSGIESDLDPLINELTLTITTKFTGRVLPFNIETLLMRLGHLRTCPTSMTNRLQVLRTLITVHEEAADEVAEFFQHPLILHLKAYCEDLQRTVIKHDLGSELVTSINNILSRWPVTPAHTHA